MAGLLTYAYFLLSFPSRLYATVVCGVKMLPMQQALTAAGTVPDFHRIPFSSLRFEGLAEPLGDANVTIVW
jgi:hypothetical protein